MDGESELTRSSIRLCRFILERNGDGTVMALGEIILAERMSVSDAALAGLITSVHAARKPMLN